MAAKKKTAKKKTKVQLKNLKPKKKPGKKGGLAAAAVPNSVVCPKSSSPQ